MAYFDDLIAELEDDNFEVAQEILEIIAEETPEDYEEAKYWFDDRKSGNEWKH